MDDSLRLMVLGSDVCKNIKDFLYPELEWDECYKLVGETYEKVKKNSRKFYPALNEIDFLIELKNYGKEELIEAENLKE